MQFTFDLDIAGIVAAATAPERIQPMLDVAITKAIKDALDEATGYRSEFKKQLTEQLTQALPHGLGVDDTAKFQHLLNTAMSTAIHSANAETIKTAIDKVVGAVLPNVPSRVNLSDVIEEARGGLLKEDHEAFYARLDLRDYGGGCLYLDKDERCRSVYSASTRLAFNSAGEVYALKLDGVDITPKTLPQVIGAFEGQLLAFYVGRSTLNVDMDADDVEYACDAKED